MIDDSDEDRISRSEMRTLARAAKERWEISDDARTSAVERLTKILSDPNSKNREVISATRALAALDKLNLESDSGPVIHQHTVTVEQQRKDELRERLKGLHGPSDN